MQQARGSRQTQSRCTRSDILLLSTMDATIPTRLSTTKSAVNTAASKIVFIVCYSPFLYSNRSPG